MSFVHCSSLLLTVHFPATKPSAFDTSTVRCVTHIADFEGDVPRVTGIKPRVLLSLTLQASPRSHRSRCSALPCRAQTLPSTDGSYSQRQPRCRTRDGQTVDEKERASMNLYQPIRNVGCRPAMERTQQSAPRSERHQHRRYWLESSQHTLRRSRSRGQVCFSLRADASEEMRQNRQAASVVAMRSVWTDGTRVQGG